MHSYAEEFPDFHDSNLKKIFLLIDSNDKETVRKYKHNVEAAQLIRRHKKDIINNVARWTGEKKYMVSELTETIIKRSKALKLISHKDDMISVIELTTYIATSVMNYLYTGGYRREY